MLKKGLGSAGEIITRCINLFKIFKLYIKPKNDIDLGELALPPQSKLF